jgi:baculoviral IAP repeat-containing protein 6
MVVANHPVLVEVLLEQRPSKKQSPGLQTLVGEAIRKLLKVDTSSAGLALSLAACVHRAVPHAKAFANLSKKFAIEEDVKSEDKKEAVNLCIELLSFCGALKKTSQAAMDCLAPTLKDEWKIYAEKNRVNFTDDVLQGHHTVLEGHRFQKGPRGLSATDSAPGRMKRLWKELADLSTSL